MTDQTKNQVGKAYAYFNCSASKSEIEKELPHIRHAAQTPNHLELSLTDDIKPSASDDPELKRIILNIREAGAMYFMRAMYKGASNKQTAEEIAGILNQAFQSPLYGKNEVFRGSIFYQDKGHYVE